MNLLPQAGWLALGAILAALLADAVAEAAGQSAGLAAATLALVAAAAFGARRQGRPAALLLGIGSIGLHAGLAAIVVGGAASPPLPTGTGEWPATVVDLSSPSGDEQRAMLRLASPSDGADGWLVYAWLPRHPAVVPGDELLVRGQLRPPPEDAPGFADFLRSRGAAGTLTSRSMELRGGGRGLLPAIEQLRWSIDEALARPMPEPEAGLASGILIGLRERVGREVADDFTITGLTHVVAISGWNIALVAGIATGLLRAVGLGRRVRSLLVLLAIVAYTVLAGAEASVIRAAVMGGVVLLAREGGRASSAAAALGVAAWLLLLADPGMIEDIGLQLSLAATAGLLALGAPAEAAVARLARGRAPGWLCETLGVSLAAQLATLPLILLHFGRLSLISPLANLLVAPVVPFAMLGALVAVLVGAVVSAPAAILLTAPLMLASWLPLTAMVRGSALLSEVPLASLELASPLDLAGAGLAALALAGALRRTRRRGSGTLNRTSPAVKPAPGPLPGAGQPHTRGRGRVVGGVGAATLLIAVGGCVLIARPAALLHVSVLDVGQGDAILLESSGGGRLLVDGGGDPDLLVRRLDERIPLWDRRIDIALLTHPHEDHAGGLAGLAPRYSVGRIAETGMASGGAGTTELRAAAARHGITRVRLAQGDEFRLGPVHLRVVWPPRAAIPARVPSTGRAINDTSIVLVASLGRQRILLTGDIEEDRDDELIAALPIDGRRWDLLKVAHHGSATASSLPLLEALRPRVSVVSAGLGNPYGHPAPSALERLRAVGSRIWRTDLQGTFSMTFDGRTRLAAGRAMGRLASLPCPPLGPADRDQHVRARSGCYARPDGGAHANRGALTAHVHVAVAPALPPCHGRGRGGGLPGASCCPGRRARRPSAGRDSRAPPRHRQGPAGGRSGAVAGPRCRRGGLAERGRAPRAGTCHHLASGHAPG